MSARLLSVMSGLGSAARRGASRFLRFTNCLNEFCHHSTQLINADAGF